MEQTVADHTQWACMYCGYVYDPAQGSPELGIPPGVAWEDLPDDWCCPLCGGDPTDFDKVSN